MLCNGVMIKKKMVWVGYGGCLRTYDCGLENWTNESLNKKRGSLLVVLVVDVGQTSLLRLALHLDFPSHFFAP